jgi:hypothetical protein
VGDEEADGSGGVPKPAVVHEHRVRIDALRAREVDGVERLGFAMDVARMTSTSAIRLVASAGSSAARYSPSASLSGSSMTSLTSAEESA